MGNFDPTEEGRNRFLRHKHRRPLRELMFEMFGGNAHSLLSRLERAMNVGPGSQEAFEQHVRAIMRHCRRLPGSNLAERRLAYMRACVEDLEVLRFGSTDKKNTSDYASPVTLLAERVGINEKIAEQTCCELYFAMSWREKTRAYENDEDGSWLGKRVREIIRKAIKARYPIRYLKIVQLNEGIARRKYERAKR